MPPRGGGPASLALRLRALARLQGGPDRIPGVAGTAFPRPGLRGSEVRMAGDMSDTFEGLHTQGEVNRLLGETLGEELDEEFIARQRTRLEDIRDALLRGHAGIQEEGRR